VAYAAAITASTRVLADGRRVLTVLVVETDAEATSEYVLRASSSGTSTVSGTLDLPRSGYITHVQCKLVSGAGATVQPRWGQASGWTDDTADAIDGLDTAAAYHAEGVALPYTLHPTSAPAIYGRSTVSAGSNNVVHTRITIVEAG